jgi:hypothetical protein
MLVGQPVSKLHREAPHTGYSTEQFAKRVPCDAKRSRLGVLTTGFPKQATASARRSSGMNKMMLGRRPAGFASSVEAASALPVAARDEASEAPEAPSNCRRVNDLPTAIISSNRQQTKVGWRTLASEEI